MIDVTYRVDDQEVLDYIERFNTRAGKFIYLALTDSIGEVSRRSVSDFMTVRTYNSKSGTYGPRLTSKLHINTGRLSRSIQRQQSFAQGSGGTDESIRRIKISGSSFSAVFGTSVPYAAIHEFGGTIPARFVRPRKPGGVLSWQPNIPGAPRRFSKGHQVRAGNMPARPYLAPALEASQEKIIDIFIQRMNEAIEVR